MDVSGSVDLFSGGSSSASSGTSGGNTTGGLGASLNLSGAQIRGHTINDGLDAQETAALFSNILGNTTKQASKAISNTWDNITNSNGFKIAFIGIGALIAWYFIKKKRSRKR